ncbi:MAG: efflux RND transporter permease subunit [Elusimicrobia bacterium]|nr:efflux RND transporter permease subunit [Elusimicrobiota bacterium]
MDATRHRRAQSRHRRPAVIVILVLLLGNLRAALITAVTIPLTLLITFIVMKRMGMSGNLMSLGALDFGIIVDGVVIVIDNCVRRVHHRSLELGRALKKDELARTIEEATLEIRQSARFGQIIIVVVFLPIFAFTGVEGKMFVRWWGPSASLSWPPSSSPSPSPRPSRASSSKGDVGEKEPWLMLKIRRAYEPTLKLFLKHRAWVLALGAFSILLGGFLFTRLGGEFLPQLDEGSSLSNSFAPAPSASTKPWPLQGRPKPSSGSSPRSATFSAASAPLRSPPTPWA